MTHKYLICNIVHDTHAAIVMLEDITTADVTSELHNDFSKVTQIITINKQSDDNSSSLEVMNISLQDKLGFEQFSSLGIIRPRMR